MTPVTWDCGCFRKKSVAYARWSSTVVSGKAAVQVVDRLLADNPDEIVLEPMSKFPVIRDLMVNRQRLFHSLKRVQAWVPVDSYYDMGPGERQFMEQQANYPANLDALSFGTTGSMSTIFENRTYEKCQRDRGRV